ncbi:MAG: VacJ family lipoprotein [Proteobacteria bacterium]|nr:VacJ family lipoprotein [Pseudomonadota bacterium]
MNKLATAIIAFLIFFFSADSLIAYDPAIQTSTEDEHGSILIALESGNSDQEFLDDEPDFLKEENTDDEINISIADPLYYWNLSMFHFNDKMYFWALKPLTQAYLYITPTIVRTGVDNFFYNIKMPVRFTNCILQGRIVIAGHELLRFMINSTQGILGFDDAANNYTWLKKGEEDLGRTFASYGIGDGIYLVWPFFGPSTLKDSFGMFGDRFLNPVSYLEPLELSLGVTGYEVVNKTSFKIGDYEAFKKASLEPYEGLRNAYIQNRRKNINESPLNIISHGLLGW